MALEPLKISLSNEPDPELRSMQRRFWIGLSFTVPVFIIAMGSMIPIAFRHALFASIYDGS